MTYSPTGIRFTNDRTLGLSLMIDGHWKETAYHIITYMSHHIAAVRRNYRISGDHCLPIVRQNVDNIF